MPLRYTQICLLDIHILGYTQLCLFDIPFPEVYIFFSSIRNQYKPEKIEISLEDNLYNISNTHLILIK